MTTDTDPRIEALYPDGSRMAPPLFPAIPAHFPAAFKAALRREFKRAEIVARALYQDGYGQACERQAKRIRDAARRAWNKLPPLTAAATREDMEAQSRILWDMESEGDSIVRLYRRAYGEHASAMRQAARAEECRRLDAEIRARRLEQWWLR